jgi:hypothetical protein
MLCIIWLKRFVWIDSQQVTQWTLIEKRVIGGNTSEAANVRMWIRSRRILRPEGVRVTTFRELFPMSDVILTTLF